MKVIPVSLIQCNYSPSHEVTRRGPQARFIFQLPTTHSVKNSGQVLHFVLFLSVSPCFLWMKAILLANRIGRDHAEIVMYGVVINHFVYYCIESRAQETENFSMQTGLLG
jgi:hypothetical protein